MLTQGDQYSIYDKITENGTPIDINKIKNIELMLFFYERRKNERNKSL